MLTNPRRSFTPILAFAALVVTTPTVMAQNQFNPYGNSGYADYREFTTPMYSNDPSLPGQARLQGQGIGGRSRANQFEDYSNSLGGRDASTAEGTRNGRPAAPSGVPYFQAYRQYDKEFQRVYKPNDSEANRRYEDRMKQREEAYSKVLAERDPVKRAKLLRLYEQVSIDRPTLPATGRPRAASPASPSAARTGPASAASRTQPAPRASIPGRPSMTNPASSPIPAGNTTVGPAPASNPSAIPIPPPR